MAVEQLIRGSRKILVQNQKIGIGIRLESTQMDIHTVTDIAVVCKSKTKGIYTIWYGEPQDEEGSIIDETINCNGSSWRDDDLRVSIDFTKIPKDIEKMSIITCILWGKELKQHYGLLEKGYMHIYSYEEKQELLEQNINCQAHKEKTGMIWAELYTYKGTWKIRAIEEAVEVKDLGQLAQVAGSYL